MVRALLGVLVLAAQGQIPAPAPPEASLHGFLIASSDAIVVGRAKKEPALDRGYTAEDLRKRFPAPRFEVHRWDADYALVVDTETGPFQGTHDRTVLLRVLAARLGSNRLLRTTDLSDEAAQALGNLMGSVSIDPKTGERSLPATIGLRLTTVVVATQGSTSKRATRMEDDEASGRGTNELFAARRGELSATRPAEPRRVAPAPPSDSLLLTAVGYGHDLTAGAERMAPVLQETRRRLRLAQSEATSALMKKLGLGGEATLKGDLAHGQMPKDAWNSYGDSLIKDWQASGFGSSAEAQSFFDGSTISLTTQIGIMQVFDPGTDGAYDPSNPKAFRPGAAGVDIIATEPGVFVP